MPSTDCPYNCQNGKLLNVALRQFVPCPHCEKIRAEEVTEDRVSDVADLSLTDKLHLRKPVVGLTFDMDCVIPEYAKRELELSSVEEVANVLQDLTNKAVLGEIPSNSYLINLGGKANIDAFVYQYIMKSYKAGVSVAPFVTALDVLRTRVADEKYEFSSDEDDEEMHLSDLTKPQLCVVLIDTGATVREMDAVRGLMQLRARNNLPTIVFTLYWHKKLKYMLYESEDSLYHLAKLVSIKYLNNADDYVDEYSGRDNIPAMTSEAFDNMFKPKNSL